MKKGKILVVGLIGLLAAGGLVLAGCDSDTTDNNNDNNNNNSNSNNTGNDGNNTGNSGNNEIEGGIRVLGTVNGLNIILDPLKIPDGTAGIQYYISRPEYKKPVVIWFEVSEAPQTLLYPYTESGNEYTVKAQYTKSGGNEPFAKEVKATAQGGIGEIFLRNDSTVSYLGSSRNVEVSPKPDIKYPTQGQRYVGLILYQASPMQAVYYTEFSDIAATEFSLNLFTGNDAQMWGDKPLSAYYDKMVYVELGYYFSYDNKDYKVVVGNTPTFTLPYLTN